MREGFEKGLHDYHDAIVELKEEGVVIDTDVLSEPDIAELIDRTAKHFHTTARAQENIFKLQGMKSEIMEALHQTLHAINEGKGVISGEDAHLVRYDSENDTLLATIDASEVPLRASELYTDGEWNIEYALPGTVPRTILRRFALSCAKRELQALLDRQIVEDEVGRKNYASGRSKGGSVFHRIQEGTFQEGMGNIAEKMVRNFLTKAAMDLDLDITVIKADLYQDTIEKIDFIIRRKSRNRGVEVSETDGTDIGIQFTTNTSREGQQHKQEQLEMARLHAKEVGEVDDIVLVTMPLQSTGALYAEWSARPMPGGPEKLWSSEIKVKVLRGILEGILSEEEVDAAVARLSE